MNTLSRIYGDDVHIKLNSVCDFYRKGLIEDEDYLLYTDNEGYTDISFKILDIDDKCRGYMAGYNILFYDYSQLIENADGEDENLFNIVLNTKNHIKDVREPQSIYFNLFINKNMSYEVEGYLYIHLKDMLYHLLHYVPDYIAGYIRKETFELVENELKELGFFVNNENEECLEVILIRGSV